MTRLGAVNQCANARVYKRINTRTTKNMVPIMAAGKPKNIRIEVSKK